MDILENKLGDGTPWWLVKPENAKSDWVVLWIYGFTSSAGKHQEGCVRMANATDVPFALVDYAGHGLNPASLENVTRNQQYDEVSAVYDELVKLGYKKIIIIGASFGGYLAALLSGDKQPEALVLRAPANYGDDEWETPYSQTRRKKNKDADFRTTYTDTFVNKATESVTEFNGKTWVVEHENDDIIPPTIPKSYFYAAKNGKYLIGEGLSHSFEPLHDEEKLRYVATMENYVCEIVTEITS